MPQVPYSLEATRSYLGAEPSTYVQRSVAIELARVSYERGVNLLSGTARGSNPGVLCVRDGDLTIFIGKAKV